MRVIIKDNDISDSITGINLSIWFAGCPHKCEKCHNQNLWGQNSLNDVDYKTVLQAITDNLNGSTIKKGISILGGEPLAPYNITDCCKLISDIRKQFPDIIIYLWTGYLYEDLLKNKLFKKTIKKVDYFIDGPFDYRKYKSNLKLRGSTNQRVFVIKRKLFGYKISLLEDDL